MTNEIRDIPPDMRKVFRRLRRSRSSHRRRLPLPDSLLAARELAREHGINRSAKALKIILGPVPSKIGHSFGQGLTRSLSMSTLTPSCALAIRSAMVL